MPDYMFYLKMRYKSVFSALAKVMFMQSILILSVGALAFVFSQGNHFFPFFYTSLLSFLITVIFKVLSRGNKTESMNVQDAMLTVFFIWTISILVSAMPFYFGKILGLTQSIFESASGWSTTGLTVIADVESIPKVYLLWRSIIQYIGGAGFALIMIVVAGNSGAGLYQAEGRTDNLVPNIRDSAKLILVIYLTWAVAGITALMIFGKLSFFDAFNHALTALATGGFSTKNSSIGYFNNVTAELIIMILMISGATGFGVHYSLVQLIKNYFKSRKDLTNGKINRLDFKERMKAEPFLKNPEPKTMFYTLVISMILLVVLCTVHIYSLPQAVRHSVFTAISALTGTGFQTVTFEKWNTLGLFVITILMIFGGMTDSTSGGLKTFRVYVIIKVMILQVKNYFRPQGTEHHIEVYKGVGKKKIDLGVFKEVIAVVFMYIIVFITGSLILVGHGFSLEDSMFEFSSALSAVGLTVGITAPDAPPSILWTLIGGMYLGRFEFFLIFYAVIRLIKDLMLRIKK